MRYQESGAARAGFSFRGFLCGGSGAALPSQSPDAPQFVKDYVEWGAGPRASQYLILGAKARTILQGRYAVSIEDIQALAPSVLRHRIVPNFKAQGEGLSSLDIISRLLTEVKPATDGKAVAQLGFQTSEIWDFERLASENSHALQTHPSS